MKTLKVKKVILKNPRLRTIRCNMRIVLKLAVYSELERLRHLKRIYYDKQHLTSSQDRRETYLIKTSNALSERLSNSTCQCNSGRCISHRELVEKGLVKPSERSPDIDLVWIPWYKVWVCVKCYDSYYKNATLDEFVERRSISLWESRVPDKEIAKYERYLKKTYADSFKNKD